MVQLSLQWTRVWLKSLWTHLVVMHATPWFSNLHQKKQHQKNMIHHGETLFVNLAKVWIGQLCHKQCVKKARGNGLYTLTGDLMVYQRQVRSGVWPPVPWGTAACGLLALLVMGAGVLRVLGMVWNRFASLIKELKLWLSQAMLVLKQISSLGEFHFAAWRGGCEFLTWPKSLALPHKNLCRCLFSKWILMESLA